MRDRIHARFFLRENVYIPVRTTAVSARLCGFSRRAFCGGRVRDYALLRACSQQHALLHICRAGERRHVSAAQRASLSVFRVALLRPCAFLKPLRVHPHAAACLRA